MVLSALSEQQKPRYGVPWLLGQEDLTDVSAKTKPLVLTSIFTGNALLVSGHCWLPLFMWTSSRQAIPAKLADRLCAVHWPFFPCPCVRCMGWVMRMLFCIWTWRLYLSSVMSHKEPSFQSSLVLRTTPNGRAPVHEVCEVRCAITARGALTTKPAGKGGHYYQCFWFQMT